MRALLLAALMAATCVLGAQVTSLPGYTGPLPGKVWSGYITVDAAHNRRIFYIFVESFRDPATDPLSLWLTGGPGCSGLIAAFAEHGPWRMNFTADGNGLEYNEYAWSQVANMIYIESPAGVGFSSSNDTADYITGDIRTANDSYAFLQGFYKEFPQFASNDFWVTGESYGGHYVPELVHRILEGNKAANTTGDKVVPLKGWMAGNPWTDPETEAWGVVQNWWDRAIIGRPTWRAINEFCTYKEITFWIINNVTAGVMRTKAQREAQWTEAQKIMKRDKMFAGWSSQKCFEALGNASLVQFGDVDIEGVYLDMCVPGVKQIPDQPNPCALAQLSTYLNRRDVQEAFHVEGVIPNGKWEACSVLVNTHYSAADTKHSVLPIYQAAIAASDLHILVYSGDNDAIVPYTGTRMWLEKLDMPIKTGNHEWYVNTNGKQVGGWATVYDRLTFTTVRGAGHMVPLMKPHRALHMFETFLANHSL